MRISEMIPFSLLLLIPFPECQCSKMNIPEKHNRLKSSNIIQRQKDTLLQKSPAPHQPSVNHTVRSRSINESTMLSTSEPHSDERPALYQGSNVHLMAHAQPMASYLSRINIQGSTPEDWRQEAEYMITRNPITGINTCCNIMRHAIYLRMEILFNKMTAALIGENSPLLRTRAEMIKELRLSGKVVDKKALRVLLKSIATIVSELTDMWPIIIRMGATKIMLDLGRALQVLDRLEGSVEHKELRLAAIRQLGYEDTFQFLPEGLSAEAYNQEVLLAVFQAAKAGHHELIIMLMQSFGLDMPISWVAHALAGAIAAGHQSLVSQITLMHPIFTIMAACYETMNPLRNRIRDILQLRGKTIASLDMSTVKEIGRLGLLLATNNFLHRLYSPKFWAGSFIKAAMHAAIPSGHYEHFVALINMLDASGIVFFKRGDHIKGPLPTDPIKRARFLKLFIKMGFLSGSTSAVAVGDMLQSAAANNQKDSVETIIDNCCDNEREKEQLLLFAIRGTRLSPYPDVLRLLVLKYRALLQTAAVRIALWNLIMDSFRRRRGKHFRLLVDQVDIRWFTLGLLDDYHITLSNQNQEAIIFQTRMLRYYRKNVLKIVESAEISGVTVSPIAIVEVMNIAGVSELLIENSFDKVFMVACKNSMKDLAGKLLATERAKRSSPVELIRKHIVDQIFSISASELEVLASSAEGVFAEAISTWIKFDPERTAFKDLQTQLRLHILMPIWIEIFANQRSMRTGLVLPTEPQLECPICKVDFLPITEASVIDHSSMIETPCGHKLHFICLWEYAHAVSKDTIRVGCPMCRADLFQF
jgi:hypothetical protein